MVTGQITNSFERGVFEDDQISSVSARVNVTTKHERCLVEIDALHAVGCVAVNFTTNKVIDPLFVWLYTFGLYVVLHGP